MKASKKTKKKELIEDFDKQYYILKEEEEKEAYRRSVILVFISCLTLLTAIVITTYYYYRATNQTPVPEYKEPVIENKNRMLSVSFGDGSSFNLEDIKAGTKETKTFTVSNTGNVGLKYKINWASVTNGIEDKENIVVTIVKNGKIVVNKEQLPAKDKNIFSYLDLGVDKEDKYEIIIESLKKAETTDTTETKEENNNLKTEKFKGTIKVELDNV